MVSAEPRGMNSVHSTWGPWENCPMHSGAILPESLSDTDRPKVADEPTLEKG